MKPIYLHLAEIPGDSRTAPFKNWIALDSVSLSGIYSQTSKRETSAGTISAIKSLDRATQKLQDAWVRGSDLGDATVTFGGDIYYLFKATFLKVIEFQSGEPDPKQRIELGYEGAKIMTAAEYVTEGRKPPSKTSRP